MPTETTIRNATMDDYASVCQLLQELDDHHVQIRPDVFQRYDDPKSHRERISRFVKKSDARLFVAELNADIVGLATIRISENSKAPMFRSKWRACMDNIVVKREFRNLGVAKALLAQITEWTRSQNLECIEINVWNENLAGLSFFTTNGFTPQCQKMELRIDKAT